MSTLTQEQLDLVADGFEENFTAKPALAKPGNRAKRAPKRLHGSWWDDRQAAKELVLSKARPICDDILSRNSEQNTITVSTKSGPKDFSWSSAAPAWGLPLLMFSVIMATQEIEELYDFDDRTEDGIMRHSDIVEWIQEAVKDARASKNRPEDAA